MTFFIQQFEAVIDPTILKRGLDYFNKNLVTAVGKDDKNRLLFDVEGLEIYRVTLQLSNDEVINQFCSCPYDKGPHCKHLAASLFYLQKDVLNISPKTQRKSKSTVRKKKEEKWIELLENLELESLKSFLKEKLAEDPKLQKAFVLRFDEKSPGEYLKNIRSMIKSSLRYAKGSKGFIFWDAARKLSREIHEFLQRAEEEAENEQYLHAFVTASVVLEEFTKALNYADDSNGDIGSCIDRSLNLLFQIATQAPNLSESERQMMRKFCFERFRDQSFNGWDWHLSMMDLAASLAQNKTQAHDVINELQQTPFDKYNREIALLIEYELIERFDSQQTSLQFVESNLSFPKFRRIAITRAMEENDLEKAKNYALKGLELNEHSYPGLQKEWLHFLLQISQLQNNTADLIYYAKKLLLQFYRGDLDQFQLIKQHITKEEWPTFLLELFKEIEAQKSYHNNDLLLAIAAAEEQWDRLIDYLETLKYIHYFDEYAHLLPKNYTPRIQQAYRQYILDFVETNVGRKHYSHACQYLRKLKKMDAQELVEELIQFFRQTYPQRKALMEELDRV